MDILSQHGIGSGFSKGSKLAIDTMQMQANADKLFNVATLNVTSFTYDANAGEIYCLNTSARVIYVHDLATWTLKRTLTLPATNDANYYIGNITSIVVTGAGRLYVGGMDYTGYYPTLAEINKNTGASIKKLVIYVSTNTLNPWLFEIHSNQFYIGSWTGKIHVVDLELAGVVASYLYSNSVGNTAYRSALDLTKDVILYAQSSNNITYAKTFSTGTALPNLHGNNQQICLITANYLVVVESSNVYKYNLTGTLVSTIAILNADGNGLLPQKAFVLSGDIIIISDVNQKYGFIVLDLNSNARIFAKQVEDVGTGGTNQSYCDAIMIDKKTTVMSHWKGYAKISIYQKLV